MTVAVFLKCGAMKRGAWTPCPKCKHTPKEPEDVARHLMTTDHYFSRDNLQAMAVRVQSGQPLHFDPKNVADIVASLESGKPDGKKLKRLMSVYFTAVLLAVSAAIAFGVYSMVKFLTE